MGKKIKSSLLLKQKRQQLGYTQKKMAELIGCTPSALCMFEKGKSDALSVERLGKACEVLDLQPGALLERSDLHYCPNPLCPTHLPYAIGDEIALKPASVVRESNDGFCGWCGEVLSVECENCQAPFDASAAFCPVCGQAYVALPELHDPNLHTLEKLRLMRDERTAFATIIEEES